MSLTEWCTIYLFLGFCAGVPVGVMIMLLVNWDNKRAQEQTKQS